MKAFMLLIAALVTGCASVPKEEPRIDGTSGSSFDETFGRLVEPLRPQDRRKLALSLFGVLLPKQCLPTGAILALTFGPVSPKDAPRIRPCRQYLNGMSYQDVIDTSQSEKRKPTPSDTSKAKPLRSSP